MSRFTRLVLPVILGLALVIAVLSVASARLGPAVDHLALAHTLDGVAVNTIIGIDFTAPMDEKSVEASLTITPPVKGTYTWAGNELFLSPRHPLAYQQSYRLTLSAAAHDRSGHSLFRPFTHVFTTQSEHLLYLGNRGSEQHRLVLATLEGQRQIVTPADHPVTDFSLSADHSLAVYVARGDPGQRPDEIWLLSLADDSAQLVFHRPDWDLSQPHLSPDGTRVVFLATNVRLCQKYYGCYRDRSGPVVYLLDLRSHRAVAFQSKNDIPITNFIDFSPAGQLAYTDLGSALTLASPDGSHILHIPNRGNSLEYAGFDSAGDKAVFVGQTANSTGGDVLVYVKGKYLDISSHVYDSSTPSLSPDGQAVAYAAYRRESGIEPVYGINLYHFADGTTTHLTSPRTESDWQPRWSPDSHYLCFVRSAPTEPMYMGSGAIWVIPASGRTARSLHDTGSNPQWVG